MKKLALLVSFISLIACEREIDYQIPDPGTKIVLDGTLEAERAASLYLSESVYSLSNEDPATRNDFMVELLPSDTNAPLTMRWIEINQVGEPRYVYNSLESIEAGRSYSLKVQDQSLPDLEVSVRVPEYPVLRNISYDKDTKNLEFEIRDNGNQANYYMITVERLGRDQITHSSIDPILEFLEFDIFIGDDFDGRFYGTRSFCTDETFNGGNRKFSIRVEDWGSLNSGDSFNLRIHNISESYYRHEITKAAYFNSDGFFSEPVQIHSNVDGGYGIMRTSASSIQTLSF